MPNIFITQFDYDRLTQLLAKKSPHDDYDEALLEELEKAEIIDPKEIPQDVITMNSQVRFKDGQGRLREYRDWETDRKSTRLNSSHSGESRMPSSA